MHRIYGRGYTLQQYLDMQRSNPAVYQKVTFALAFFRQHFPWKLPEDLVSELVCHDYSQAVTIASLSVGTSLIGYKSPDSNPVGGSYFAPVGTPIPRLGLGFQSRLSTGAVVPKKLFRYRVKATIPAALQSICAPARDTWSIGKDGSNPGLAQYGGGGATQYVIPKAGTFLEEDEEYNKRRVPKARVP